MLQWAPDATLIRLQMLNMIQFSLVCFRSFGSAIELLFHCDEPIAKWLHLYLDA